MSQDFSKIDISFQGREYSNAPDVLILSPGMTVEYLEKIKAECLSVMALGIESGVMFDLEYAVYEPDESFQWEVERSFVSCSFAGCGDGGVVLYQSWVGSDHSGDVIETEGFSVDDLIDYLKREKKAA